MPKGPIGARAKVDNDVALVPPLTQKRNSVETKAQFSARIESGNCGLSESECSLQHPSGCRKAMIEQRGTMYLYQKVWDERLNGVRGICPLETQWYLINDPRSEFSINYGKTDVITFETMVARYSQFVKKNGGFNDRPVKEAAQGFNHKVHETDIRNVAPFTEEMEGLFLEGKNKDILDVPEEKFEEDWPEEFPNMIRGGHVNPPIKGGLRKEDMKEVSTKPAKMTEIIRWVFDNLPVVDFDKSNCPSPAAIAMLQWARSDPDKFFSNFVARLIPTQREIDKDGKLEEQAGQAMPILEQILNERNLSPHSK